MTKEDLTGDVLQIANGLQVSPVMVIRHLLQLEGLSKREVRETVEGIIPPPDDLKHPLKIALRNDPVFSPRGIMFSKKRGEIAEDILANWLDSLSFKYTRDLGQGGPDFNLEGTIELDINGRLKQFDWIESKASYADAFQIRRNRSQFEKYRVLGKGLIFYWYGIEADLDWDVYIWKDLYKLVDKPLKSRIRSFIAFVPREFRHLIH